MMQRRSQMFSLGLCVLLSSIILLAQEPATVTPPPASGGGTTGGGTGGGTGGNTGGNTGGIGGNTGGTIGNRPQVPFPGQDQRRTPDFDQMQNRPIFLSGKVMMEDGGPPQEPVTIERICMGRGTGGPIPEAYTDSKGRFSFQVGQRAGMMPDASMGNDTMGSQGGGGFGSMPGMNNRNGVTERDLMSCEIRASLPGFRSTVVNLSGRRSLDNPDIGTIILRRLADVSGFTTSSTSLLAPKEAKKAFEKGINAAKKNKLTDAQRELETATTLHPRYAEAWFEHGRVMEIQKNNEAARASYEKSLAADEKFVSPYLAIAMLDARENKWPEVKQLTEKVIKLNRYDFPVAYFYGAVANYNLRDNETAEKLCKAGIEADQFHRLPKMSHLLGMILADKQEFSAATEQLKTYLKFAPKAPDIENVKKQLADLEGRVAATTPK